MSGNCKQKPSVSTKTFALFQCISSVAFVKNESDILEQPCWVMLINVVAMDMLKTKIPPGNSKDYSSITIS